MAEEMGATVPTATADTTDTSTGQDAAESHFTGSDGAGGSAEHTTWDELPLSLEHVAQLVASGVTPEQAEQRGYRRSPTTTGSVCATSSGSRRGPPSGRRGC